jgi:hypothetical protein
LINDPIPFSDVDFSDLSNYTIFDTITSSSPAGDVTGSVGVPEPGSLPLIAAGLMALAGLTLRRSRKCRVSEVLAPTRP